MNPGNSLLSRIMLPVPILVLILVLFSGLFVPVQAAFGSQSAMDDHSMGVGHDGENESIAMHGTTAPGSGSGTGVTTIMPVIYGLFVIVIILVLIIFYILFIRHRHRRSGDEEGMPDQDKNNSAVSSGHEGILATGFPAGLESRYSDAVLIGKGGLSYVYSAKSKETGETVAVKIPVKRDERSGKLFLQEIKIWEELDHPNIVSLKSVNVFPIPYAEMEYIPDSLESFKKPLESEIAIIIAAGILRGLSYAHKKGIIHCDIKPGNILIDSEFTPKITDWGVGRSLSAGGGTKFQGYTPAFAAPEQLSPGAGQCTGKTDIFQVGMLIFRMLCGKTVFDRYLGQNPLTYLSECIKDERLRSIVSKCIRNDPGERYESAEELLSELLSLSGNTVLK